MKKLKHEIFGWALCAAVIALILIAASFFPYMEARTYNKFKSPEAPEATFLDAVFSDLRVTTQ